MLRYRCTAAILAASMLSCSVPCLTAGAEDEYADSATIYYLTEENQEYLTVPDTIPQSYQITLDGEYESVRFTTPSRYIAVDENGLVTPVGFEVYNLSTGETTIDYQAGTYYVTAYADSETFTYEITLSDYAEYYANAVIDTYMDANITDDMTVYEKLTKICEFVASYDYSVYHSDRISMIVTGEGGDCWASTATVNYMCNLLGMRARTRRATEDPGAGSGHRNSIVEADGKLYIVDAGYAGTAPRGYHIKEQTSAFTYTILSDNTLQITEYFGFDPDVTVPETIDGYTVSSIGGSVFYNSNSYLPEPITSVALPDTITHIGASAFSGCDALRELYLPKNVETIEMAAFYDCADLTLTVDPENPYLTTQDGILFSKDMKTLIEAYNFKEESYAVPEGVEYIGDCAFYFNRDLKAITFPETLKDIGFKAFAYCTLRGQNIVLPESVTGVGCQAFYSTYLSSITFLNPDCVINNTTENNLNEQENGTTLGGIGYHSTSPVLVGLTGSTAEAYAQTYGEYSENVSVYNYDTGSYEKIPLTETGYYFAEYSETEERSLDTGSCSDDLSWELFWSKEDGTAMRLAGTGAIPEILSKSDLSFTKHSIVSKLVIEEGVTAIEANAFSTLGNISSIVIPASVTSIDASSTKSCTLLDTVHGYYGTAAEAFAEEMGYTFVPLGFVKGDVNKDGSCNVLDIIMMQQYLLGTNTLTLPEAGELTGDSTLNAFDLAAMKRMVILQNA